MTSVGHSIALVGGRGAGGIVGGRRGADGRGSLATAAPPHVTCSVPPGSLPAYVDRPTTPVRMATASIARRGALRAVTRGPLHLRPLPSAPRRPGDSVGTPLLHGHAFCPEGQPGDTGGTSAFISRCRSVARASSGRRGASVRAELQLLATRALRLRGREGARASEWHLDLKAEVTTLRRRDGARSAASGAPTLPPGRREGQWRGTQVEGPPCHRAQGAPAGRCSRSSREPECWVEPRRRVVTPGATEHVTRGGAAVARDPAPLALPSSAENASRPAHSNQR